EFTEIRSVHPASPICPRFTTALRSPSDAKDATKRATKEKHHGPLPWERSTATFCLVLSRRDCLPAARFRLLRPKFGNPACYRSSGTGTDRGSAGRHRAQPGELGRQCDLSCRSGAGGGHGSRLLLPGARG